MLLLLGSLIRAVRVWVGLDVEAVGMGMPHWMLLPNVFDEWTFLKASGEGKMVPTSLVCLRVAFITISKSPAKRIQNSTWHILLQLLCLIHTLLSLKSGPLLCNWPACTLLLTSLTFDLLELRFWETPLWEWWDKVLEDDKESAETWNNNRRLDS